jgi:hypothetical protein
MIWSDRSWVNADESLTLCSEGGWVSTAAQNSWKADWCLEILTRNDALTVQICTNKCTLIPICSQIVQSLCFRTICQDIPPLEGRHLCFSKLRFFFLPFCVSVGVMMRFRLSIYFHVWPKPSLTDCRYRHFPRDCPLCFDVVSVRDPWRRSVCVCKRIYSRRRWLRYRNCYLVIYRSFGSIKIN